MHVTSLNNCKKKLVVAPNNGKAHNVVYSAHMKK